MCWHTFIFETMPLKYFILIKSPIFNQELTVVVTVNFKQNLTEYPMKMLSNDRKFELTENILQSKVFQKSPKSSALLRYLVKATIEGTYLKEDVIDFEFFG